MYFASRMQAGRMLAAQIAKKYQHKKCSVLALDDGGVMVGAQVAKQLKAPLMLLSSAEIRLPREPDALAGITSGGDFAFNRSYSQGEIDELMSEYYHFVEQEKLTEMHILNHMLARGETVDRRLLKKYCIILVSDGLKTGFKLDLATEYLKPVEIDKLVVATPLASVSAVDRMHIVGDDLYCLSVIAEYLDTEHYYDEDDIPDHNTIIETLAKVVEHWK